MFFPTILAFCSYFSILLGIGIYFYKKNKNNSNISSSYRSFNYWVTAISAQASDMSDWLFMGFPGVIYAFGLSEIWIAVGLILFMFFTWQFIAPALRKQTEELHVFTLSEFFEKKFNDKTNLIRIINGLFCLYFFTYYIAAGLVGLGRVFEVAFNINYHIGILLGLCITLIYTLLGGLVAVAWSNLLQGTFLLFCIMLVPFFATYQLGGFSEFIKHLALVDSHYFSFFPTTGIFVTILNILQWGPGYFGQPHILINFININNANNIYKAKIIGLCWQFLALSSAIFVGVVGRIMFFPNLTNPELVFIFMVKELFNPFFGGFILCSILAATISTINSQSLISASLISNDLYFTLFKPQATQQNKIMFTRLAILIIPILSLIIAQNENLKVFELVYYAWTGLGCTFGPLVILGLYTNIINGKGALAGLVSGALTAIFWPSHYFISTMIAGYFINTITALSVSTLSSLKKPN